MPARGPFARPIAPRPDSSGLTASRSPRDGSRLAATCPRYDRVVVYRVEPEGKLAQIREIQLEGRPVALATLGDRFVVLETPTGDQRHVEPGWWETFDTEGNRLGGRHLAGYYPDDLAVTPDGKYLLLLSSGQAEGDAKSRCRHSKSSPFDLKAESSRVVGRITFDADRRSVPAVAVGLRTMRRRLADQDQPDPGARHLGARVASGDRADQVDGLGHPLCLLFAGF